MSKLNEEILDTLYDARANLEHDLTHWKKAPTSDEHAQQNMRLVMHKLARLDRVWDYFQARRTIEEFRSPEED